MKAANSSPSVSLRFQAGVSKGFLKAPQWTRLSSAEQSSTSNAGHSFWLRSAQERNHSLKPWWGHWRS